MAYSDKVIDHYNNPRNVGQLDKSSTEVGTGLVGAPECGDVMRLQIRVNPETQVIEEAKFKTFGCGSAIASSSLATEWIKGRTVDDALAIKNTDIVKELSLPPVKIHCSVLAEDAIRAAIGDWKKKNGVAETAEPWRRRSKIFPFRVARSAAPWKAGAGNEKAYVERGDNRIEACDGAVAVQPQPPTGQGAPPAAGGVGPTAGACR